MDKPIIIAEIGGNHKGDLAIAKEMIRIAKEVGTDSVKFQKRHLPDTMSREDYQKEHPKPENSYGDSYGIHRKYLEFPIETHKILKEYCDELGVCYSTSVWDITSAKRVAKELNPQYVKIPSATNLDFKVLKFLLRKYPGEIHISLGMTTKAEQDAIVKLIQKYKRGQDVVLYSCTSGYPVPPEDVSLLEIKDLQERFGDKVKAIGFSGHHLGTAIDMAAAALGVSHIERHFTLDRTWKGTDHPASLEPEDLRKLCQDVETVTKALNFKVKEILDIEEVQRKKLKRPEKI